MSTKQFLVFTVQSADFSKKYLSYDDIHLPRGGFKVSDSSVFFNADFKNIMNGPSVKICTIHYRIHFALNCGAKSCPPIKTFTGEEVDTQLNLATQAFLEVTREYNLIKTFL